MENTPLLKLKQLYETQYVSHTDLQDFAAEHHLKIPENTKNRIKNLFNFGLPKTPQNQLNYLLTHRHELNQKFIKREQAKKYEIEGNPLDPQQIAAVVACEDAELILAPAGSGKTASLLAKLNYLTDHLQIPEPDILVIAFTNKVVAELNDRVHQQGIEIRTFHSLGNKIVKAALPDHKLITEEQTQQFFHRTIQALLREDETYARNYQNYFGAADVKDRAAAFYDLITRGHQDAASDAETLEALFISVLGLQKSERATLKDFRRRLEQIKNPASRQKSLDFYALYAPIAEKYAKYLEQHHLYDFADMLNISTDLVTKMPKGTFNYQYILVDEAQDLSTSKYLLLNAILKNCHKVKLFAVGDDWQSIYRFAGSNLRVLDDFEQIFGRETYRGLIELTYRFGQPTAKISNKFIQKNPHQSKKKVVPHVKRKTPIEIKLNPTIPKNAQNSTPPDYLAVDQKLQELYQLYGDELFHKKIQIISRYNRDIFRLVDESAQHHENAKLLSAEESSTEFEWQITKSGRKLKIPFCSVHKAKGITRDIIIIINANSGNHGIPATRASDSAAEALLTKLDAYPHAEERRLWYVAITRAKERTIIIADARHISPFVFEVSPKLSGAGVKVCPKCHRGIMEEKRRQDGKLYYACSNRLAGCRHTEQ